MPDFTEIDKFSSDKAFSQIVFADDTYLLEVELVELQKIQNYQRALMARTLLTSGFAAKLPMNLSEGTLTVPADTILANGDFLEIKEAMVLENIALGDVVYLSISEVEVDSLSLLQKSGNLSGGSIIENNLIDYRVGAETTHRMQKQVELVKVNTDPSKLYFSVAMITGETTFVDTRAKIGFNSPQLLGFPTVPTAPANTNTDQIASTNYVALQALSLRRYDQMNAEWDAPDLDLVVGSLVDDALCWTGKSVYYAQPEVPEVAIIAKASYGLLRFGKFSVGFRLRASNVTEEHGVLKLKVLMSDDSVISSLTVKGIDFADVGADAYKMIYIPFDNRGQSSENLFTFVVASEAIIDSAISIDSIFVTPVHAAGYAEVTVDAP